jgi:hypothetical protein
LEIEITIFLLLLRRPSRAVSSLSHLFSIELTQKMNRLTAAALITCVLHLMVQQNDAFCPCVMMRRRHASSVQTRQHKATALSQSFMFADATEPKNSEPIKQVDVNGKEFLPGTVVAIAPGAKVNAHHVPKDAYGSFDPDTREFIPADESNMSRSTSCLVLSEGIQGEVTKVYNVNEWDRAHPILVQFKEGLDKEGGEGFILPKSFTMHFSANEIVVVV